MNKGELVLSISEKSGLAKKDAEAALNAFIDSVEEALERNEKVQLVGFGNFDVKERAARLGRNPKTGEEIHIPATKVPAFTPGKEFKNLIKG